MFAKPGSSGSASSVRLPAINSDRSMISARSSTPIRSNPWAFDIRKRINDGVKSGDSIDDDVDELKKELIKLFIAGIQSNKKHDWKLVIEGLECCLPLKEYLQGDEMMTHYIERVYFHHSSQNHRFGGLDVCDRIERVFPQETKCVASWANCRRRRFNLSHGPKFQEKSVHERTLDPVLSFRTDPRTEEEIFNKPLISHPISSPKDLTVGDLVGSLPQVLDMSAKYESTWAKATGTTSKALAFDFSLYEPEDVKILRKIEEEMREDETSSTEPEDYSSFGSEAPVYMVDQAPLSGRQAIEYFYKHFHLGKVRVMFFNVQKQRHFNPYALKAVPKALIEPEHYIFSTFGVLYVSDHGPGEIMSLSAWQREAVIYKAVAKIPFFKNFILTKFLSRWKENINRIKFLKKKDQLSEALVTNVSIFCKSLLQLMKLLDELHSVRLLPFDNGKRYCIGEFENDANYKNIQAGEVIEKFHGYVQFIVNETAAELLKKLKYCQDQVHHKTVFTNDSLHLQKLKHETRQKALDDARREASQLGNFIRYVDQLIASQFVNIVLSNVHAYVNDILTSFGNDCNAPFITRLAAFETNLAFDSQNQLTLEPTLQSFYDSLISYIRRMPRLLTKSSIPLDGLILESVLPRSANISKSFDESSPESGEIQEKLPAGRKSIMTNKDLQKNIGVKHLIPPNSSREKLPTKQDDNLRVATPEYVHRMCNVQDELQVVGEGFVGQYSPLKVTNITDILDHNTLYNQTMERLVTIFDEAKEDVARLFDDYQWLLEIQNHCRNWNETSVQKWKGAQAYAIEQELNNLRAWTDRVKAMDQYYVTGNKLIFINCQNLQESLLQQLSNSYRQLIGFVIGEASYIGKEFVQEMREILKNLQNKSTSVEVFAQFSTSVQKYRSDIVRYQGSAEYFKTLLEVIRVSYRQLTTEEERLEEQVQTAWEAFLVQIQDAAEFVSQQRQIVIRYVDDTFEKLEVDANEIIEYLLSERFRDPGRKPLEVLSDIRHKRDDLYNIHNQLQNLSRSREMIIGTPFDLKSMKAMTSAIDSRQELWKFMEVATHAIKDWKNMFFRKFNVSAAIEKITEWQHAGVGLEAHFSPDDPVLTEYQGLLSDFKRHLPHMAKMASPVLKARHWHTLLVGLNSPFESHLNLKVIDFLSLNLEHFEKLIVSVYEGAVSEYKIEQRFLNLKRIWNEKTFKIGKYIPSRTALRQIEVDKQLRMRAQTPTQARRRPRMEEFEQLNKEKSSKGFSEPLDVYVLMDSDDFFLALKDSIVELDNIMQSPFVHELLNEVKLLHSNLSEVSQVVEQLMYCQQKWTFLRRIFEQPSLGSHIDAEHINFAPLDRQFIEIMQSVTEHPQVLLMASQEQGSKTFRILQGWHLLALLTKLTVELKDIILRLRSLFNTFRKNFYLLHFLNDDELIELLGISRDPQVLLPFVKRFFPGIQCIEFRLPDIQLGSRSIDVALNSSKLVTSGFKGTFGDEVCFQEPVPQLMTPTAWLMDFQQRMKTSQYELLRTCVRLRIEGQDPLHFIRKVLTTEIKEKENSLKVLDIPINLQIVAENVLFARQVDKAFETMERGSIEELRKNSTNRLKDVVEVLNDVFSTGDIDGSVRHRLSLLCQKLTLCVREHLDILEVLATSSSKNERSFEWLRVFRYSMKILRSSTIVVETISPTVGDEDEEEQLPLRQGPVVSRRRSSRRRPLVSLGLIEEKAPKTVQHRAVVRDVPEIHEVRATQMGILLDYDYEYVCGNANSIVWTPLTERCLLSLTQTLHNFQLGALVGVPGSGKSETLRMLGNSLGRHTQPIICSEEMDINVLRDYTIGALLNGSLLILEHLNDLTLSVISSLSEMLFYLKFALSSISMESGNSEHYEMKKTRKTTSSGRRRHSISKEIDIDIKNFFPDQDSYTNMFFDHMLIRFGKDMNLPRRNEKSYNHYTPNHLGNILFGGEMLNVRTTFGTLCSVNYGPQAKLQIPESLKVIYRPCALLMQSLPHIVRALLISQGFSFVDELLTKMTKFCDAINESLDGFKLSLHHLRMVIQSSGKKLREWRSVPSTALSTGLDSEYGSSTTSPRSFMSAASSLFDEKVVREEEALVGGLMEVVSPLLQSSITSKSFDHMLHAVFSISAHSALLKQRERVLITNIREQLQRNSLSAGSATLNKITQLNACLMGAGEHASRAVLICGPPGCGKSVLLDTLLSALSHSGPSVERLSIHLDAFRLEDIFGNLLGPRDLDQTGLGLLGTILARHQHRLRGESMTCIHIDGHLNGPVCAKLNCLLSQPAAITNPSGRYVQCHESIRFVLESCDLRSIDPRILTHVSIVNVNNDLLDSMQIWNSWLQDAKMKYMITEGGRVILSEVLQSFIPKLEKFSSRIPHHAIYENIGVWKEEIKMEFHLIFQQFLTILDSLLSKYFRRDHWEGENPTSLRESQTGRNEHCLPPHWMKIEDDIDLYYALLESFIIYSIIWSIGCSIPEKNRDEFENIFRNILQSRPIEVEMNENDSVFDLMIDMRSGSLIQWNEKHVEKLRTKNIIVPTHETERVKSLISLLLNAKHPVLLFGPAGVGKSVMMEQFINKVYQATKVHMSPKITARLLQGVISSEHQHHLERVFASPDQTRRVKQSSQQLVCCLDDLHLSITDSNSGNPEELVRQIIVEKGTFHHSRFVWENYPSINFAATCCTFGCLGAGSASVNYPISVRFLRLFSLINVFKPKENTIERIFSSLLSPWITDFPKNSIDHPTFFVKMISRSLIAAFNKIREEFRATPITPHYAFTFHQLFQTIQSLFILTPRNLPRLLHARSKIKSGRSDVSELSRHSQHFPRLQDLCPLTIPMIRLWYHELLRTFQDRMHDNRDKTRCDSILREVIARYFCDSLTSYSKDGLMSAIQEESVVSKSEIVEEDGSLPDADNSSVNQRSNSEPVDEDSLRLGKEETPPKLTSKTVEHQQAGEMTQLLYSEYGKDSITETDTDMETNDGSETTTTQGASRPSVGNLSINGPKGIKRGVSFKANVFDSGDQFTGPLVASIEQVLPTLNASSDITYVTKAIIAFAEDWTMDKNYVEISRDALFQCLQTSLVSFNCAMNENEDIVFLWNTLQQVARLTRSFALKPGNSILISKTNKVGRSTLTKLAAYIDHRKYFQICDSICNWRSIIKSASLSAGLQNRKVVLFVKWFGNDELFQSLCQIVREGLCPGLFDNADKAEILHTLAPNIAQSGKHEKIEQVMKSFSNSIKDNINFVISISGDSQALGDILSTHPILLTLSTNVSSFEDWSFDSMYHIAKTWLSESHVHDAVQWKIDHIHEQIHYASEMLAHYHLESAMHSSLAVQKSPNELKCCIHVFTTLAEAIRSKETVQLKRYTQAVNRIEDVNQRIADYINLLEVMRPKLQKHRQSIDGQKQILNEHKSDYLSQLEKCKEQENLVEEFRRPLDDLKRETQAEFDQVNPVYFAALSAMKCLDYSVVLEVQSYAAPPSAICKLIDLICLLLGVEKSCLHSGESKEFFNALQYFDKDHISEKHYKLLGKALEDEDLNVEGMKLKSIAASELCKWVHNIYKYATICRKMNPKLGKLLAQEEKVNRAQSQLGRKRIQAEAIKQKLETLVQEHRESVRKCKEMEKEMQTIEKRLKEADTIKDHLQLYELDWRELQKKSEMRLMTVQADALICGIIVIYYSSQSQTSRAEIIQNIIHGFRPRFNSTGDTSENTNPTTCKDTEAQFSLRSPFDFKEIVLSALFEDGKLDAPIESDQMIWNIVILRSLLLSDNQKWPLVYDPSGRLDGFCNTILPKDRISEIGEQSQMSEEESENLTGALKSSDVFEIDCKNENFEQIMIEHCQKGSVLLLRNIEYQQHLSHIVRTMLAQDLQYNADGSRYFDFGEEVRVKCHSKFRVIIVLRLHPMQSYPGSYYLQRENFTSINNTLDTDDISHIVFKKLVQLERPEYESQVASLVKDRFSGQILLFREREHVLSATSNSDVNLIDRPGIIHTLKVCHDNILRQEEILTENEVMFQQLRAKISPLQSVVENILNLVATLEDMRQMCNLYFCDTLIFINQIFLNFHSIIRFPGLVGSVTARSHELIDFTSHEAMKFANQIMEETQFLTFITIYCLRRLEHEGIVKEDEVKCFLAPVESICEENYAAIPASEYFTTNHLMATKNLEEALPVFCGITQSLIRHGRQWYQYFQLQFSTTTPIPESHKFPHLTNFQKAILWKVLVPSKTKDVVMELVREYLGGQFPCSQHFSFTRMFSMTDSYKPIILHLPHWSYDWSCSKGNNLNYILDEIIQRASIENPYSICALNFGQRDVWDLINGTLRTMASNGGWLILQNIHLLDEWDDTFLRELEMVYADKTAIHPKFRLFCTTESITRSLPVRLQRLGTKFVCNTTFNNENVLREVITSAQHAKTMTLRTNANCPVPDEIMIEKFMSYVGCVHFALRHHQLAGKTAFLNNYPWTLSDFSSVPSTLRLLGNDNQVNFKVMMLLIKQTYLRHVLEIEDKEYIERLIEAVWQSIDNFEFLHRSDSLCDSAYEGITSAIIHKGEVLLCQDLNANLASSSLMKKSGIYKYDSSSTEFYQAELLRCRLEDFIDECCILDEERKSQNVSNISPQQLIQDERIMLDKALRYLSLKLQHISAAENGTIACSRYAKDCVKALKTNKLPEDWKAFHQTDSIDRWFDALRLRVNFLNGWTKEIYEEINFLHLRNPRKFLQALLVCSNRRAGGDSSSMQMILTIHPRIESCNYPVSDFVVRGAAWDKNAQHIIPSIWNNIARIPKMFLSFVNSKSDELTQRIKCHFVDNHVLLSGDANHCSDVLFQLELPGRLEFARTPLVTQFV